MMNVLRWVASWKFEIGFDGYYIELTDTIKEYLGEEGAKFPIIMWPCSFRAFQEWPKW